MKNYHFFRKLRTLFYFYSSALSAKYSLAYFLLGRLCFLGMYTFTFEFRLEYILQKCYDSGHVLCENNPHFAVFSCMTSRR